MVQRKRLSCCWAGESDIFCATSRARLAPDVGTVYGRDLGPRMPARPSCPGPTPWRPSSTFPQAEPLSQAQGSVRPREQGLGAGISFQATFPDLGPCNSVPWAREASSLGLSCQSGYVASVHEA